MKLNKLSSFIGSAAFLSLVLFGYQNCSQARFTSDLDGAMLKAEAISDDGRDAGDDGQVPGSDVPDVPPGDGQPTPTPTPVPNMSPSPGTSPSPGMSPAPGASPSPVASPTPEDRKGGPKDSSTPPSGSSVPPQSGGSGKDKDGSNSSDLVECQMLHPNKKVVLDYSMRVQHGNSSSVRVCMSTNACLKLINDFAIQHSCSLDGSAPMSQDDAQRQCTEIFPGSKGTCHNAAILSDAQVSELLGKLNP